MTVNSKSSANRIGIVAEKHMNFMRKYLFLLFFFLLACGNPEPEKNTFVHITLSGPINRSHIYQVARALDRADEMKAEMLIISLDSSGGSVFAGRKIIQLIAESPQPVAVHVRPAGAVVSAMALLIYLSADLRAMAAGTSIGIPNAVDALPLGASSDKETSLAQKQSEALFFSITTKSNIPRAIAEDLWRTNRAFTPQEALQNGLTHIIVNDTESLVKNTGTLNLITNKGAINKLHTENSRIIRLNTPFYLKVYSFLLDYGFYGILFSVPIFFLICTAILLIVLIVVWKKLSRRTDHSNRSEHSDQ